MAKEQHMWQQRQQLMEYERARAVEYHPRHRRAPRDKQTGEMTGNEAGLGQGRGAAGGEVSGDLQNVLNKNTGSGFQYALKEIRSTLSRLDKVYSATDPEQERARRHAAATTINRVARGVLTRKHLQQFTASLTAWRSRRCFPFLTVSAAHFARVSALNTAMNGMREIRENRTKYICLEGWCEFVAVMKPRRLARAQEATRFAFRFRRRFYLRIITRWRDCANGSHSRKAVARSYRQRLAAGRARVASRGHTGDERSVQKLVRAEMRREATHTIRRRRKVCIKRWHLRAWYNHVWLPWHQKESKAVHHFKIMSYRHIFARWRLYIVKKYQDGPGRMKWANTDRFTPFHNARVVDTHAAQVHLQKHLRAWHLFVARHLEAGRRYRRIVNALLTRIFRAWAARAQWQTKAKRLCVEEWVDYGRRLTLVPFRAWFMWASLRRQKHAVTRTLLQAFHRRKRRLVLWRNFRMWHHQAVYGKVEGMRTRVELIGVLEQQRTFLRALEESMAKTRTALEEGQNALASENRRCMEKDLFIRGKKQEALRMTFQLHSLEREMARVQTMLDNVALIHPGTVRQLRQLGEDHQFRDRGFEPLARIAAESLGANGDANGGGDGDGSGGGGGGVGATTGRGGVGEVLRAPDGTVLGVNFAQPLPNRAAAAAAAASAAGSSDAQARSEDECWFYRDAFGTMQGPFTSRDINAWHSRVRGHTADRGVFGDRPLSARAERPATLVRRLAMRFNAGAAAADSASMFMASLPVLLGVQASVTPDQRRAMARSRRQQQMEREREQAYLRSGGGGSGGGGGGSGGGGSGGEDDPATLAGSPTAASAAAMSPLLVPAPVAAAQAETSRIASVGALPASLVSVSRADAALLLRAHWVAERGRTAEARLNAERKRQAELEAERAALAQLNAKKEEAVRQRAAAEAEADREAEAERAALEREVDSESEGSAQGSPRAPKASPSPPAAVAGRVAVAATTVRGGSSAGKVADSAKAKGTARTQGEAEGEEEGEAMPTLCSAEVEAMRITALLDFILTGRSTSLEVANTPFVLMEEEEEEELSAAGSRASAAAKDMDWGGPVVSKKRVRRKKTFREKLRLDRLSSWHDFMQTLSQGFPLQHALNTGPKAKMEARLAHARRVHLDKQLGIVSRRFNALSSHARDELMEEELDQGPSLPTRGVHKPRPVEQKEEEEEEDEGEIVD